MRLRKMVEKLCVMLLPNITEFISTGGCWIDGRLYKSVVIDGFEYTIRRRRCDRHIDLSREEIYRLKGLIKQQEELCDWVAPEYKGDIQRSIVMTGLHL